jgi:hypothetical protein
MKIASPESALSGSLRADLRENPRRETVARRTCRAVKQTFQSENAIGGSHAPQTHGRQLENV